MGELYGASFVLLCVLLCGVTVESRGGDIMMTEVGLLEFELELELFCSLIIFNGFIGRIFPAWREEEIDEGKVGGKVGEVEDGRDGEGGIEDGGEDVGEEGLDGLFISWANFNA